MVFNVRAFCLLATILFGFVLALYLQLDPLVLPSDPISDHDETISIQQSRRLSSAKRHHALHDHNYNGLLEDPRTVTLKDDTDVTQPEQPTIMYTFYEPTRILEGHAGRRGTGMTEESDQALLALWKESWSRVGFEPRILRLQDAMNHPRYEEFYERLRKIPMYGGQRAGLNTEYNYYCYLRWLAMATVGGGFQSDYDVLPFRKLEDSSSGVGDFTLYYTGRENLGVPCLMSGSASEWERMAFALLRNGEEHAATTPDMNMWTDMMALQDVHDSVPYVPKKLVVDASLVITGEEWSEADCRHLRGRAAIHFSHHALSLSKAADGKSIDAHLRPTIAAAILEAIGDFCDGSVTGDLHLRGRSTKRKLGFFDPTDPKSVSLKQLLPPKPKIYTFFKSVQTIALNGRKGTGMTEEADARRRCAYGKIRRMGTDDPNTRGCQATPTV